MYGRILAARIAVVVALLGAVTPAQAGTGYVPFVTDFGTPAAASSSPYVPFVTDFPQPAPAPLASATATGTDWWDAGIRGLSGAALAALLAASVLVLARRASVARGSRTNGAMS